MSDNIKKNGVLFQIMENQKVDKKEIVKMLWNESEVHKKNVPFHAFAHKVLIKIFIFTYGKEGYLHVSE